MVFEPLTTKPGVHAKRAPLFHAVIPVRVAFALLVGNKSEPVEEAFLQIFLKRKLLPEGFAKLAVVEVAVSALALFTYQQLSLTLLAFITVEGI